MNLDRADERRMMVQTQILSRGVKNKRVLRAMEMVPRHFFVPEEFAGVAYHDHPIPIGHDQTISQPYIVARMTELLAPEEGDIILEIGTGSGYQAAVLSAMGARVISLERIVELVDGALSNLQKAGVGNVSVFVSDGTLGWENMAPYDGIIITAATPAVPSILIEQLAVNGRIVAPVGPQHMQVLVRLTRSTEGIRREEYDGVRFVPLIGRNSWNS
ncbi:MAG TPA: protein-L-isoaspartate(D-aspartate) O-methyltransferase [Methanospirillum sp.]|uniref:protein-L-isoaspartate(D-aspartate) O-methyltransferase n=1 Tax=Methanospirillum sp. TaxID=45200 RepID=UPI002C121988|nr:protein-L-isoaspartate(D-aspartate) O-methyltransferase [Methanospirillum sp.]HWQ63171.1 protein-L-isoaspartate(D-aspartate) O-methyltransferase [Methanospirillum sp.]